jgi:hypothetical protein
VASSVSFTWSDRNLQKRLKAAKGRAHSYLALTTSAEALRTQNAARKGAKWTDRSGNARSGLTGTWEAKRRANGGEYTINLFHTVKYGFFLEVVKFTRKGDLSIIKPTIDLRGPIYMKTASKVIDRIFENA